MEQRYQLKPGSTFTIKTPDGQEFTGLAGEVTIERQTETVDFMGRRERIVTGSGVVTMRGALSNFTTTVPAEPPSSQPVPKLPRSPLLKPATTAPAGRMPWQPATVDSDDDLAGMIGDAIAASVAPPAEKHETPIERKPDEAYADNPLYGSF